MPEPPLPIKNHCRCSVFCTYTKHYRCARTPITYKKTTAGVVFFVPIQNTTGVPEPPLPIKNHCRCSVFCTYTKHYRCARTPITYTTARGYVQPLTTEHCGSVHYITIRDSMLLTAAGLTRSPLYLIGDAASRCGLSRVGYFIPLNGRRQLNGHPPSFVYLCCLTGSSDLEHPSRWSRKKFGFPNMIPLFIVSQCNAHPAMIFWQRSVSYQQSSEVIHSPREYVSSSRITNCQ